jgi:hypothetical protein
MRRTNGIAFGGGVILEGGLAAALFSELLKGCRERASDSDAALQALAAAADASSAAATAELAAETALATALGTLAAEIANEADMFYREFFRCYLLQCNLLSLYDL